MVLTDFQVFNKSVDDPEEYISLTKDSITQITLPYSQNVFSIEYAALSYFAPEKNEYAFMLEGFDRDWNYVGNQRRTTYTNLSPGVYTFRVKASNNDGIWNDEGLTLRIVISPPLWRTNIAMVLYIIIFGLLIIIVGKYMKRINERKNKLKLEKLRVAHEKEIHDAKINFFTTIAHEIRTPVSLIIAPLEKIIENSNHLPEKIKGDLNIIDRNSQRLLFLVNQLLDFRKMEQELIPLSFTECNIDELLLGICERFRPSLEQHNITLQYTSDNNDFKTITDADNLTKAISNLLNNASKFATDYIELSLETKNHDGIYRISVANNGEYIPTEYQQKIFNLFYQVPGNIRSGTGIGLNLVKKIVDAFSGTIDVYSVKDGLTKFTIQLPEITDQKDCNLLLSESSLSDQIMVDVNENNYENEQIGTQINYADKFVILIVEDNPDIQEFLSKNLSDTYHVISANNGIEGLRVMDENEIHLIVSDIMMDGMDGIEFCTQIRQNIVWSHIPIIMLTAKNNIDTKVEAMENGADAYIEKPFSMRFLSAQIKNLLSIRESLQKKYAEIPSVPLKSMARNKAEEQFLSKVNGIIEKNISNENFSMDDLAEELCISSSGLFAKIKNLSGCTSNKLLLLVRLKKAVELLQEDDYRINEVCYMVGFSNPSYFAKCFQKQFGVLPKDFKNIQP